MDVNLTRRPSATESTSSSGGEVTFDDVDDSQVFAYLDEGDEHGSLTPPAPRTVEFRLDFSTRVNPPVQNAANSASTLSRRPSTGSLVASSRYSAGTTSRALQRSPSMRASAPTLRKRLSRRASEISTQAVLAATNSKSISVRSESPPSSPVRPLTPDASLPISVGPCISAATKISSLVGAPIPEALIAAVTVTHAPVVEKLEAENESLRSELSIIRLSSVDLLERLQAAQHQNGSITEQLTAMQDAYEIKLRCAYDEAASDRQELVNQKELEVQTLRTAFEEERHLLEQDMKTTIAKIECELQSDSERLQRLLRDGREQTNSLKAQIVSLQADLKASETEKQHLFVSDASLIARYEALQANADHWESKCQGLQDQVHQLLYEQDEMRKREQAHRRASEMKAALQHALHERFRLQVQLLQQQLKTLATESRQTIEREMMRTTILLNRLHQQASELAIQQNDNAMALVTKQNRIIQLEAQLKNERQSVLQLDSSLAKANRLMQKKESCFRNKLQEQKEFLDITVAVRNGLTNELQSKKKKLEELEMQLQEAKRGKDAIERKNRHLSQQIKIMQHVHAREMEQVALTQQQKLNNSRQSCRTSVPSSQRVGGTSVFSVSGGVTASYKFSSLRKKPSTSATSSSAEANERGLGVDGDECDLKCEDPSRRGWVPEADEFAAEEWREFVELAVLHEAECCKALQGHHVEQHRKHGGP